MKIAYFKDSKELKNSEFCTAIEYPLGDKEINATVIQLKGRYPDKGWAVNLDCKELVYVIEGQGTLEMESKTYKLKQKDVVLIDRGEKFIWDGNMTLFMPSTPAWSPDQHKIVD